ncbi:gas vesicle protein GvpO [Puerhibacterium puerhi]|uniref:gas vesicle protein GvpO n=1 Tax=Puerhibacterium puerhi TaxID=2692623 RepID=UPI001916137D|nr:gas vesicle protein GvpO [Puerhibacterium puerhi]
MSETSTRDTERAPERRPRRRAEDADRPERRARPRPGRRERAEGAERRRRPTSDDSAVHDGSAERDDRDERAERAERGERRERPAGDRRQQAPRRPTRRRDEQADVRDGAGDDVDVHDGDGDGQGDEARRGRRRPRLGAGEAARRARDELAALIRHEVEGVVAVERSEDTWLVTLDVVEDPHVPSSSDVLAEYEVRLDADGDLLAYRRGRRFVRGRVEG